MNSPDRHWRLVGKLNYLMIIRLNIAFAISVISQFLLALKMGHWNATI